MRALTEPRCRVARCTSPAARKLAFTLAAGMIFANTACRVTMPRSAETPMPAPEDNAALFEYIGTLPLLTAEPAYRAVYILWKGQPFSGSFDELTSALVADGIVGQGWNLGPDDCVDRAAVGYMVCRAAKIPGGLNWTLTGLGRYGYRELLYRDIAQTPAGEFNLISGGEFAGIIHGAETDLHRRQKAAHPRVELGEEPGTEPTSTPTSEPG